MIISDASEVENKSSANPKTFRQSKRSFSQNPLNMIDNRKTANFNSDNLPATDADADVDESLLRTVYEHSQTKPLQQSHRPKAPR